MSDFDDRALDDAIESFRMETLTHVTPAGAAAAFVTVRRRHRNRLAALGLLIAVLVLVPVAAFASLSGGRSTPTPLGVSPTPTGTGTPSPSPVPSPGSPSPGSPTSGAPAAAPDAPTDLSGATLTVPAWIGVDLAKCPSGRQAFTSGRSSAPGDYQLTIDATAAVDVDHDGGTETIVVLRCMVLTDGPTEVLAVKAHPDGGLGTLAMVTHSDSDAADTLGVSAAPNGQVAVRVGDIGLCCMTPRAQQISQVRTFAYRDGAFHQAAGQRTFTADRSVADLVVSAPTVRLGTPDSAGARAGTLRLTVHNKGPKEAPGVSLFLDLDPGLVPGAGGDWTTCPGSSSTGPERSAICQLGPVPAGATRTLTLPITTTGGQEAPSTGQVRLQPRTVNQKYPMVSVPVAFD